MAFCLVQSGQFQMNPSAAVRSALGRRICLRANMFGGREAVPEGAGSGASARSVASSRDSDAVKA